MFALSQLSSSARSSSSSSSPAPASRDRRSDLRGRSYDEQRAALAPEQAARAGTAAGGMALPHLDVIQASFGRHDVSDVRAHVGPAARQACGELGADGYAFGSDVAFTAAPSLHLAAHEAAHVVQQRAGVSLSGGEGRAGDAHEQHADAVADLVVRGQSAEGLLDRYAGVGAAATRAVQRNAGATRRPMTAAEVRAHLVRRNTGADLEARIWTGIETFRSATDSALADLKLNDALPKPPNEDSLLSLILHVVSGVVGIVAPALTLLKYGSVLAKTSDQARLVANKRWSKIADIAKGAKTHGREIAGQAGRAASVAKAVGSGPQLVPLGAKALKGARKQTRKAMTTALDAVARAHTRSTWKDGGGFKWEIDAINAIFGPKLDEEVSQMRGQVGPHARALVLDPAHWPEALTTTPCSHPDKTTDDLQSLSVAESELVKLAARAYLVQAFGGREDWVDDHGGVNLAAVADHFRARFDTVWQGAKAKYFISIAAADHRDSLHDEDNDGKVDADVHRDVFGKPWCDVEAKDDALSGTAEFDKDFDDYGEKLDPRFRLGDGGEGLRVEASDLSLDSSASRCQRAVDTVGVLDLEARLLAAGAS